MNTTRTLLCAVVLASAALRPAFAADAASNADADLVHLDVHESAAAGGKPLDMRVDEVARDPDASTVVVTFVSGGSVASSMFVMRGVCAVTRARGKTAFHSESVAGTPGRYRITFPSVDDAPMIDVPAGNGRPARRRPDVVTLQQCALVGF